MVCGEIFVVLTVGLDAGHGTWDTGHGTQDTGHRTQDIGQDIGHRTLVLFNDENFCKP